MSKRPAIIDGDIAKIPLGVDAKDGYALVEIEDAWIGRYKWTLHPGGYAVIGGRSCLMHQLIMGRRGVDHINRNRLDNRRSNLRLATPSENLSNKPAQKNNKLGIKGVSYHAKAGKFVAQIAKDGQHFHLGLFPTPEEAAQAYNQAALKYHGEFANLNTTRSAVV